jgi:hypothetical protein
MTTKPFRDLSWRWRMFAGRWILGVDNDDDRSIVLRGGQAMTLITSDGEAGVLRDLDPSDDIAKIIAAAPDVRRHAQSLINGIDIGLVRIESDADDTLALILGNLRIALAKSGDA